VVRALPACLEAGREAVEEELDAELEALVAVGDDRVGHGADDREPVRGQPAGPNGGGSGLRAEGLG